MAIRSLISTALIGAITLTGASAITAAPKYGKNRDTSTSVSSTSTVDFLLDKYDVEDPVISNEVGVFTNNELQALYNTLVERGIASFIDALYVGALIEEKDMKDILAAMERSDERAIILAYSNLLDGSKNHLRAFVSVIEAQDLVYEAQVLDPDEVSLILESEEH